jgi:hypothetical protein
MDEGRDFDPRTPFDPPCTPSAIVRWDELGGRADTLPSQTLVCFGQNPSELVGLHEVAMRPDLYVYISAPPMYGLFWLYELLANNVPMAVVYDACGRRIAGPYAWQLAHEKSPVITANGIDTRRDDGVRCINCGAVVSDRWAHATVGCPTPPPMTVRAEREVFMNQRLITQTRSWLRGINNVSPDERRQRQMERDVFLIRRKEGRLMDEHDRVTQVTKRRRSTSQAGAGAGAGSAPQAAGPAPRTVVRAVQRKASVQMAARATRLLGGRSPSVRRIGPLLPATAPPAQSASS